MDIVKGGSGSIFGERLMQNYANRVIIVVDERKLSTAVGQRPIPVEIVAKDWPFTIRNISRVCEDLGLGEHRTILRRGQLSNTLSDGDVPSITDNNNYIVDIYFKDPLVDPSLFSHELDQVVGVVCHGLFSGQATTIMVASTDKKQPVRIVGDHDDAVPVWWSAPPFQKGYEWESILSRHK